MKYIVLVNQGLEALAAQEVVSFGAKVLEQKPSCIIIETTIENSIVIAYRAQIINRVLSYITHFSFKSLEDFEDQLKKIDVPQLDKTLTFAARSQQQNSKLQSSEIQPIVGEVVAEKTKAKVNLSNPDAIVFIHINNDQAYIGVDITGDISKRDYRIYVQRDALKATVAYGALLFAEWNPKYTLLDPFCRTGLIAIEAALAATNTSNHFFKKEKLLLHKLPEFKKKNPTKILEKEDKKITKAPKDIYAMDQSMRSVDATKKNAKIAGVNKAIQFSRKELSWLDTKFDENSVDRIVSAIPQPSKMLSEQQAGKIYHEFFYQCNYILKKNGKIALITKHPDLLINDAKRHGFQEKNRIKVTQGQDELIFILFSK